MILVIGATGVVGQDVVRILTSQGRRVRAMVRRGGDPAKVESLSRTGAELVPGDLKDPSSLLTACEGIATVVSTASATISRGEGDSIDRVDRDGQRQLIDAARQVGVQHFVYLSFSSNIQGDFPLCLAKRAVEDHLLKSGLASTIVRPSFFMEVWLSPHAGFDPVGGRVRIYGTGENPVSLISASDVAQFVAGCVDNPAVHGETIELGGPEPVTPLAVVGLFEQGLAREIAREHVPEAALEQQLAGSGDPLQRTLAGLALSFARGDAIDPAPALAKVRIRMTPVQEFVRRTCAAAAGH